MRFRGDHPSSWCVGVAEWSSWQRWTAVRPFSHLFALASQRFRSGSPRQALPPRGSPATRPARTSQPSLQFACINQQLSSSLLPFYSQYISCLFHYLNRFYFDLYFLYWHIRFDFSFAIDAKIIHHRLKRWEKGYTIKNFCFICAQQVKIKKNNNGSAFCTRLIC